MQAPPSPRKRIAVISPNSRPPPWRLTALLLLVGTGGWFLLRSIDDVSLKLLAAAAWAGAFGALTLEFIRELRSSLACSITEEGPHLLIRRSHHFWTSTVRVNRGEVTGVETVALDVSPGQPIELRVQLSTGPSIPLVTAARRGADLSASAASLAKELGVPALRRIAEA